MFGCGPWLGEITCESRSPVVLSKVWMKVTLPASRDSVRPWTMLSFWGIPLKVETKVVVPSPLSVAVPPLRSDPEISIDFPVAAAVKMKVKWISAQLEPSPKD